MDDQTAINLRRFCVQNCSEESLEVFSLDKFHMLKANGSILIILNTAGDTVLSLVVNTEIRHKF